MKRKTLITSTLAAFAGLAAAGGIAFASGDWEHSRGGHFSEMLEQADTNGDGALSREEVEAWRGQRFDAADANGNGEVTLEEFQTAMLAHMQERMERMFSHLDQNDDGVIVRDETGGMMDRMFEHHDDNGDGLISEDEMRGRHDD